MENITQTNLTTNSTIEDTVIDDNATRKLCITKNTLTYNQEYINVFLGITNILF